uniref:Uncharacterized protein n=1 Tax=Myoviridae sp. ctm8X17 TaxID=2825168 RepID=A0A8S5Q9W9_9CAUD|nr:MAG TPA: hypothetical protein [Myoviridae sp. ctm8X17]
MLRCVLAFGCPTPVHFRLTYLFVPCDIIVHFFVSFVNR